MDIYLDNSNTVQFNAVTPLGYTIEAMKESLWCPENPDIAWIPSTVPEYRASAADLDEEQLQQIKSPVKLSPLQEEWLSLHERLWHLPFSVMFHLCKLGFLPK